MMRSSRRKSIERLVDRLGVVLWEFDWSTKSLTYVSAGVERLLGYTPDEMMRPRFWESIVHPDDRWMMEQCFEATKLGEDHELEYRCRHADGTYRWLREIVTVDTETGLDGPVDGVIIDITAQRTAEDQRAQRAKDLEASEQRYRQVVERAPYAVFLLDADGVTIYANPAAARLVDAESPDALIGLTAERFCIEDAMFSSGRPENRIVTEREDPGTPVSPGIASLTTLSGRRIDIVRTMVSIDIDGRHATLVMARDISLELAATRELRESEERFRRLLTESPLGIQLYHVSADGDLIITETNRASDEMLGNDGAEQRGRTMIDVYPNADRSIVDACVRIAREGGAWTATELPFSVDGRRTRAYDVQAFQLRQGELAIVFQDVTERVAARDMDLTRQQRLSRLAAELAAAEDRERRRLAEELHDRVSQPLAVARMNMKHAAAESGEAATDAAELAIELLDLAIQEARSLTTELFPSVLRQLGLPAAVGWLADETKRMHRLQLETYIEELSVPLSEETQATLFRVARELLANVVKHAEATYVRVSFELDDADVVLTVEDNGKGLKEAGATSASANGGGFGLFSVRERIGALGGSLVIASSARGGAVARVRVPVGSAGEAARPT